MADYKVVFRADESANSETLLWEPSCPALLVAVQVSRNVQTSEAYLQVKLRNVSDEGIDSVYGVAAVSFTDASSAAVDFEDYDVDLMPGAQKALKATPLPRGDVESASVKLTRIGQLSGKWESAAEPTAIPQRAPLSLSAKAAAERQRRLESANVDNRTFSYSVVDNGGWWVCACGQVNVRRDSCCDCGSEKSRLIGAEDEEELCKSSDKWAESVFARANELAAKENDVASLSEACELYDSILDWKDSEKRSSECKERLDFLKTATARKRKRVAISIVSVIVAAIAVALLAFFVIIPMVKYNSAMSAADSGDYDEAVAVLSELGDYGDAKDQIQNVKTRQQQAQYDEATALFDDGSFDEAYTLFNSLAAFNDSKEKAIESANAAGAAAEEDNDYDSAIYWYEKSKNTDAINNAKYTFVKNNYDNNNSTTHRYLSDLKDSNYLDSSALYADLYRVTARIVINADSNDTETSLSTLGHKTNSRPVCHIYIEGGYGGDEDIALWVLEESTWGTNGNVLKDYSQNYGGRENDIVHLKRGWNTRVFRHTGSNVYDHRLTIKTLDTEEVLASAEIHTPYSY